MRYPARKRDSIAIKIVYSVVLFFVATGSTVFSQDLLPKSLPSDTTRLRVIFAGDMMGHIPLVNSCLKDDGKYDYVPIFENIQSYISSADIAVVILRCHWQDRLMPGIRNFRAPMPLLKG